MAAYSWFTIRTTAWRYVCGLSRGANNFSPLEHRTKFRRDANQADNKAATSAVDSLINYEAVKVRNWRLDGNRF